LIVPLDNPSRMKKPAIFLDRDNTLIISDGYLGDPAGVRLISGAAAAVARAQAMGFAVVVFSNQSGVARGMFSEEAVAAVNRRMDEMLRQENPGALIDRHEYCPFHPEARVERYRVDSDLRKPKPGMIFRAASAMDLDLPASWVIGDAGRDIEAGHAAGCRTILVVDPSLTPSPAALKPSPVDADETVSSLAAAMDIIEAAGGSTIGIDAADAARNATREIPGKGPAAPNPAQPQRRILLNSTSGSMRMETSKPASAAQPFIRIPQADALRPVPSDGSKLEGLAQQILEQIRGQSPAVKKFSLSKLLAGIVQVVALAVAGASYFYHPAGDPHFPLFAAIFLQLFVIALLLM
jgi:D,D-heptose 1,7-bisphosphate phosphatase